jgi:rubredoxin
MARGQPDDDRCPVCGQAYDELVVVERGDGWSDVFAGTPLSFFKRYQRRCTSVRDVERDRQLPGDRRAVYFHEGRDGVALM